MVEEEPPMLQWFFAAPLSRQQTFALLVAAALHAVIASLLPCIVRPDCRDRRMPVASPCRSLRPCPALRSRPCFASGSTREAVAWLRRRDRGRPQPSARERKEHDVLVGRGACERLGVAGLALCGPHKSGGPWL